MENKRIESLTPEELVYLNNILSYQGAIMDAAEVSGLHHQTVRLIKKVGYGKPETIAIIREKLLKAHASKVMA